MDMLSGEHYVGHVISLVIINAFTEMLHFFRQNFDVRSVSSQNIMLVNVGTRMVLEGKGPLGKPTHNLHFRESEMYCGLLLQENILK
jgi:hypothetical protein